MATFIETLADFVYNLKYDNLSPEVVSMAKLSVLHHLYTGFSGIKETDSQIALSLAMDEFRGVGKSTILGQRKKTSALGATFVNAALMHSVQQEDTLRGLHPGPHTISAAFALGEQEGSHGLDMW